MRGDRPSRCLSLFLLAEPVPCADPRCTAAQGRDSSIHCGGYSGHHHHHPHHPPLPPPPATAAAEARVRGAGGEQPPPARYSADWPGGAAALAEPGAGSCTRLRTGCLLGLRATRSRVPAAVSSRQRFEQATRLDRRDGEPSRSQGSPHGRALDPSIPSPLPPARRARPRWPRRRPGRRAERHTARAPASARAAAGGRTAGGQSGGPAGVKAEGPAGGHARLPRSSRRPRSGLAPRGGRRLPRPSRPSRLACLGCGAAAATGEYRPPGCDTDRRGSEAAGVSAPRRGQGASLCCRARSRRPVTAPATSPFTGRPPTLRAGGLSAPRWRRVLPAKQKQLRGWLPGAALPFEEQAAGVSAEGIHPIWNSC